MKNLKKIAITLGSVAFLAMGSAANALCGDVTGDGQVLNNDVAILAGYSIQEASAVAAFNALPAGADKRADVAVTGAVDGTILNNDVAIIAAKSINGITTALICNETISTGDIISFNVVFTRPQGDNSGYKGFQSGVTVTGGNLVETTAAAGSTPAQPTNTASWNTCGMTTAPASGTVTSGTVLCVDTSDKIASSDSTKTVVSLKVKVTAGSGQPVSLVFNSGLLVNSSGTTTAMTTTPFGVTGVTVN
jgi:hypothetical protein